MSATDRETRQILGEGGIVLGAAEYVAGKLHGIARQYSHNGVLVEEAHYSSGQLHGDYKSWWDNGRPKEQGYYVRGHRRGVYCWYDQAGKLIKKHDYGTAL